MTIMGSFEIQTFTKLKDLALEGDCDCENPGPVRFRVDKLGIEKLKIKTILNKCINKLESIKIKLNIIC